MRKKLQVFISSTFTDLQEERQIAVESVLNAGHIPAGMELFKSSDSTQKEVIKKWIDESDVYMLILGGRYGSIDEETNKSYTHWEYDYAGEVGKPRFSVVIDEAALAEKVKVYGMEVTERQHYQQYTIFRKEVLEKVSRFFTDSKDIKIAVLESLGEYQQDMSLNGWVAGSEIENSKKYEQENYDLLKKNMELERELKLTKEQLYKEDEIDGSPFDEVVNYLKSREVTFPDDLVELRKIKEPTMSIYKVFNTYQSAFAEGISNERGARLKEFLYLRVGLQLLPFGLLDKVDISGTPFHKIQTSKAGYKYLKQVKLSKFADKNTDVGVES